MAQIFPTTAQPFAIGQTVVIPNDVSISVDSIDRNWTPQTWQVSPFPAGYQDDATGEEVMLVHFTISNLSNAPLTYSDTYFSLARANGHEQRVAALNELAANQYGCFGQPNPWLQPGATVHTFVPFLITPDEKPKQFILTWKTVDPTRVSTVTDKNGKQITLPVYNNIARIPFMLSPLTSSTTQTSPVTQASTASSVTFVPNATFKVTTTDVYSTNGN